MKRTSKVMLAALIGLGSCLNSTAETPEPGMAPPHPVRMDLKIPAFPGAWGGGMFTTGGRGGKVLAVTNLNDRGPGSLRAAIEATGPRIVIFRVAGTIHLKSDLNINNPHITIAGQSAPGDGICIANDSININTHNVILRHLRVRRGNPEGGQGSDNIGGNPIGDIIVDHCSASWGMDENLSLYRYMKPTATGARKYPVHNLTIQWCISSEALNAGNHAFGGTWGGKDSTFHHNLFACNTARNPSIGMSGEFDFRNNVIFNWSHRTMDGGDETSLINVINNYYKPGPASNRNMRNVIARLGPNVRNMYSPGSEWAAGDWFPKTPPRPGKWYVAGNIMEGHPDVTRDNWLGIKADENFDRIEIADSVEELRRIAKVHTPFEGWPVSQETAQEAFKSVLAKAGATLPKRDSVDQRVIEMVHTGEVSVRDGIILSPDEVGGYPELTFSPEDLSLDTDADGMPDKWEIKYNLNPEGAFDGSADADGDGYTNIEEWLNGTNPREYIDYLNLGNNIDTIS